MSSTGDPGDEATYEREEISGPLGAAQPPETRETLRGPLSTSPGKEDINEEKHGKRRSGSVLRRIYLTAKRILMHCKGEGGSRRALARTQRFAYHV